MAPKYIVQIKNWGWIKWFKIGKKDILFSISCFDLTYECSPAGRRWKNKDMLEQWSWMVSCSDNLNAALALELFYFTNPSLWASSSASVDSGHSSTRSSRVQDPQSSAQERWGCRTAAAPTPQAWKIRSFSSPLNSNLPLNPSPSFPGMV